MKKKERNASSVQGAGGNREVKKDEEIPSQNAGGARGKDPIAKPVVSSR
jgi:hypothetical protein